jgi:bifunctional non-homologous end joining protein LigD
VLELDGNDVTGASWSERRGVLDALGLDGTRAVVTMASDDGEALLRATGRLGVEGVVAKRRGSRYVCGRRTGAWVKVKHRRTGWYDVAGWRLSRRGRPGGIVVADDGRVVGTAFVALPAGERHVLHELIARHGVAAGDVIHMPPGVQVRVDYLERTTTGSLREAIGRALRPTP